VRVTKEIGGGWFEELEVDVGKAMDLSATGIQLRLKKPIETGALINITFLKPNTFEFFEGHGKIVRIVESTPESTLIGVEFVDMSESDKKKLDYYLTM